MSNKRKYDDPDLHIRYRPFLKARAQANFLEQGWELTFEDFCALWTIEKQHQRGRGSFDLAMIRKDRNQPWTLLNCEIVERRTRLQQVARNRGTFVKE